MKNFILFLFLVISMNIYSQDLANFNKYFEDATMRIDYFHIGDASSEIFTIDHIYKQGIWAGSRINLLDEFNNGAYYYKIYDEDSNTLIFSKGFDSYFKEYQTSQNAQEGIKRTYHESALIPFPKNIVRLSIQKRDDKNILNEIFTLVIDPQDISILKDIVSDKNVEITKSLYNGDPHSKVDVVIIAEGYTENEKEKYQNDLQKFTQILIKQEPYKSMKESFNVYGVFKASEESGTDEPRADIYKNTTLNSTFNSLGSERYLLTEDNKTLRDLAAHVPYDAIYIMVNHKRYGGGGIYNWSCTFTADNQFQEYLFIHEFGHSFAGLADEYYTSENAYTDFYKPTLEPVEPNVTALLDSNNIKWKEYLSKDIEIPTPWEKESFDEMDYAWQKLRREMNNKTAELKRNKASLELIEKAENDYAEFDKEHSLKVDKYLQSSKYYGKVGAFEGAGYLPKGLYRPMLDCIMFSKGDKPFCKVCEAAIIKVINHYSE
ncbi:MAG: peptidase M64 [Ignavibacteriae bacterium]|nr:peptidase M64 [Ignavibacteriota bacterium]